MKTLLGQVPFSFHKVYVNGEYVESNSQDYYSLFNPKDGSLVAEKIPIADRVDVDITVKHAEAAFNGPWATFSAAQRSECLRKLADLLETRLHDVLLLDSLTTGNPVSLIPTREKNYIKNNLLYYGWLSALFSKENLTNMAKPAGPTSFEVIISLRMMASSSSCDKSLSGKFWS